MPPPPEADPRIPRIASDIQKHGWHVVKVMADDSGPAFAYSIGLFETFGHAEVLLSGFELDLMHQIINTVGGEIPNGQRVLPDKRHYFPWDPNCEEWLQENQRTFFAGGP